MLKVLQAYEILRISKGGNRIYADKEFLDDILSFSFLSKEARRQVKRDCIKWEKSKSE